MQKYLFLSLSIAGDFQENRLLFNAPKSPEHAGHSGEYLNAMPEEQQNATDSLVKRTALKIHAETNEATKNLDKSVLLQDIQNLDAKGMSAYLKILAARMGNEKRWTDFTKDTTRKNFIAGDYGKGMETGVEGYIYLAAMQKAINILSGKPDVLLDGHEKSTNSRHREDFKTLVKEGKVSHKYFSHKKTLLALATALDSNEPVTAVVKPVEAKPKKSKEKKKIDESISEVSLIEMALIDSVPAIREALNKNIISASIIDSPIANFKGIYVAFNDSSTPMLKIPKDKYPNNFSANDIVKFFQSKIGEKK